MIIIGHNMNIIFMMIKNNLIHKYLFNKDLYYHKISDPIFKYY